MATAYYTPGVYIEEVDKGPKPIQGVSTSVTAFVGFTQKAEGLNEDGLTTHSILSQPKLVTNWTQFEKHFGGLDERAYLPYAVQGFFNNGGVTAWVISIHAFDTLPSQALIHAVNPRDAGKLGTPALIVHAKDGGPGGDKIKVTLKAPSTTNSSSSNSSSSRRSSSSSAPTAAPASSASEGASSTSAESSGASASGSGGGSSTTPPSAAGGSGQPQNSSPSPDQFTLVVEREGSGQQSYTVKLDELPLWSERDRETADDHQFEHVKVWRLTKSGKLAERMPKLDTYQLSGGSPRFDLELLDEADRRQLSGPNAATVDEDDLFNRNAIRLFSGSASKRKGLDGLQAIDELNLVCAPDLAMAHQDGLVNDEGFIGVQKAMLDFCRFTDYRFAILDAPYNQRDPENILNWRNNIAGFDSMHGALYYPWVKIMDPVSGRSKFIPPSGHIAGIYARSDSQRGVHKAPANEDISGVIDVQINVTKGEQDLLNPAGINCIRKFPGRGVRVWGARTLSSDPAWRYINVRRLFNYVEESVERSMQWTVFEPNDVYLWGKVKRDITAFLRTVWRSGALFGVDPNQAFYVKCDEELNPAEIRDQGIMICEIGMAPVKPAEFVVFRFSQYSLPSA
ncbi:MAG: phage tail sheath subtilisin-like domain-containing protein [Caldilineaceae bacterium]